MPLSHCPAGVDAPRSADPHVYHSTFAPDVLTIAAHFGASSAMKAANSCGDNVFASALNLAKLALISGEARPALIAALILPTTAAGVPAGARMPVQEAGGKLG